MKQNIILWIVTIIIIFITGYLQRLTSPEYPISATVGVGGKKIIYSFDKVHYGIKDYKIIIHSEVQNISGLIEWRSFPDTTGWKTITLKNEGNLLSASIPIKNVPGKVEYRAKLNYMDKDYYLPFNKPVELKTYANVPARIFFYYYFFLYIGLILAVRTGLDAFNEKRPRMKMYSIFTTIAFFAYAFAFNPIKNTYEAGDIGTKILPMTSIFDIGPVILFAIWVIAMILIFNMKKNRPVAIVSSVITLIFFEIMNFI